MLMTPLKHAFIHAHQILGLMLKIRPEYAFLDVQIIHMDKTIQGNVLQVALLRELSQINQQHFV
jgi:hypothetical protein